MEGTQVSEASHGRPPTEHQQWADIRMKKALFLRYSTDISEFIRCSSSHYLTNTDGDDQDITSRSARIYLNI